MNIFKSNLSLFPNCLVKVSPNFLLSSARIGLVKGLNVSDNHFRTFATKATPKSHSGDKKEKKSLFRKQNAKGKPAKKGEGGKSNYKNSKDITPRTFESEKFRLVPKKPPSKLRIDYPLQGEYIYGINPVVAALNAERRKLYTLYSYEPKLEEKAEKTNDQVEETEESQITNERLLTIINLAKEKGVNVKYVSKEVLNVFVKNSPHQGVVLDAEKIDFELIYSPPAIEGQSPLWVALDKVCDPHNLGSITRSAVYFGVDGIVITKKSSSPLSATVSKVSAGASEFFPIYEAKSLHNFLRKAKEAGWRIVGTTTKEGAGEDEREIIPSYKVTLKEPTILVLGSEQLGVGRAVKEVCEAFIHIKSIPLSFTPHFNTENPQPVNITKINDVVNSLNVGVAVGVLLHQLTNSRPKNRKK